jgi:hypothetical protein
MRAVAHRAARDGPGGFGKRMSIVDHCWDAIRNLDRMTRIFRSLRRDVRDSRPSPCKAPAIFPYHAVGSPLWTPRHPHQVVTPSGSWPSFGSESSAASAWQSWPARSGPGSASSRSASASPATPWLPGPPGAGLDVPIGAAAELAATLLEAVATEGGYGARRKP